VRRKERAHAFGRERIRFQSVLFYQQGA
jgi:hypothetical protein